MTAPPVDDHTEEFEQLAGLSALDVLEGDDRARFEQHAEHCERCRVIVRLDRETLRQLSAAAPEMDPSPDFKARLLQRAADELRAREATPAPEAQRPEPIQLRPRGNVVPFYRRPWFSALAAVFVLAIGALSAIQYQNQVVATYTLTSSGPGTATVLLHRNGAAELQMQGVPDPGQGFVYEAWIIPPGQQPVAAGSLPSGQASVGLSGDVRGNTVAVTREPQSATPPAAPSSAPIMATEIRT